MADNENKSNASLADLAPATSKKTSSKKKATTKKKTTAKKVATKKATVKKEVTAKKTTTKKKVATKKVSPKKKVATTTVIDSTSTASASTAPAPASASTAPASTAPASTAPASTAPASTAPASTSPASTSPASTAPTSSEMIPFWVQVTLWVAAMAILIYAYSFLEDRQRNNSANEGSQATTVDSNITTMADEQKIATDSEGKQATNQQPDTDTVNTANEVITKNVDNKAPEIANKAKTIEVKSNASTPATPAQQATNNLHNGNKAIISQPNNQQNYGYNANRTMPAMPMNAWRKGMPTPPQAPVFEAPRMVMPQSQPNNQQYRFIAPSMQMPAPPQYQMPNNSFNRNMPAVPMPYYAPRYNSK